MRPIDMKMSPCGSGTGRGCGRAIVWGETDEGKKIPLDPSAPVYQVVSVEEATGKVLVRRLPQRFQLGVLAPALVSHFKTCPCASEFTRGKKP